MMVKNWQPIDRRFLNESPAGIFAAPRLRVTAWPNAHTEGSARHASLIGNSCRVELPFNRKTAVVLPLRKSFLIQAFANLHEVQQLFYG